MSYSIDLLSDLPVLLTKWEASFDFKEEFRKYSNEVKTLLDSLTTPLYYAIDLADFKLESMDDLMLSVELATRSGNSNFHHSMVKAIIWITTDETWKMTAKGLKHAIYGALDIAVFDTVDDALDFVHSLI